MNNTLNINNYDEKTEYKHSSYAGRGCKNIDTYYIKMVLLCKYRRFCNSCLKYLKENQLVESIVNDGNIAKIKGDCKEL
jgi:hypothetical protein